MGEVIGKGSRDGLHALRPARDVAGMRDWQRSNLAALEAWKRWDEENALLPDEFAPAGP